MPTKFESRDQSVEESLFSTVRFMVPQFQRPYSWSEDQTNDFWDDLIGEGTGFFIGQFIFNYEHFDTDGFVDIIDGQQRVTTIMLLCAALRDTAKAIGDLESSEIIQERSISASKDFDGIKYRFVASPSIKDFFENTIQGGNVDIALDLVQNDEQKNIVCNYLIFKRRIEEIIKPLQRDEKISQIINLFSKIRNTRVISTKIFNEDDAFEIFETVNARGVELSVADLLKNYIFRKVKQEGGEIDDLQIRWTDIKENLEEAEIEITKFLRYYWLSRYSFITEKKLFREIKKKEFHSYRELLGDLQKNSEILGSLRTMNYEWDEIKNGEKIRLTLDGIKVMNVTQCYVLLLTLMRNIADLPENTWRVFQAIERFNFLYHAISKQPANRIEKLYQGYSKTIEDVLALESDETAKKEEIQHIYDNLIQELKNIVPSFEVFLDGFRSLTYKKRELANYCLLKMEEAQETEEKIINSSRVNIEHILPKNPGKDWGLLKKDIRKYVDKMGNLTLLGKKNNSRVGNKSIQEKIKILEDSTEIKITKELIERIKEGGFKWSELQINERTDKMAENSYNIVWKL